MIGVRRSCPLALSSFFVALALPLGAIAQPFRRRPSSSRSTPSRLPPDARSRVVVADGDFVVVWQSYHDGSGAGVFGQRFSSAGVAQAGEFLVNTHVTSHQFRGDVSADADGDFVVVWTSQDQDGDGYGVFAQRFSSTGAPVGAEFQVNSYTLDNQVVPTVAIDADGDFVVAWIERRPGRRRQWRLRQALLERRCGASRRVPGQRAHDLGSDAIPGRRPRATAISSSSGTVASRTVKRYGVFAQRFSSAGTTQASRVPGQHLHRDYQSYPSVALTTGGGFVVAWQSYGQAGERRATSSRARSRAPETLWPASSRSTSTLRTTSATQWWRPTPMPTSSSSGRATTRTVAATASLVEPSRATGSPSTAEFQVNLPLWATSTSRRSRGPVDGDFVVSWESYGQDGSNQGVFAQRFAQGFTLDIDGDGTTQALTDGVLVLRFLFDFTGADSPRQRGRSRLHAVRRAGDRGLPRADHPGPQRRRQPGGIRSPTACSFFATCSTSPATCSSSARGPELHALQCAHDRGLPGAAQRLAGRSWPGCRVVEGTRIGRRSRLACASMGAPTPRRCSMTRVLVSIAALIALFLPIPAWSAADTPARISTSTRTA